MADAADLADATVLYPDRIDDPMTATATDAPAKRGPGRPRSTTPRAPSARKPGRPSNASKRKDYEEGINGLGQMAAFALSFKAPADAAAVMIHTPGIAKALNDLAQDKPEVAAVLDRLLSAGPYASLLTAITPLVVQIIANRNPALVGVMGAVSPEQLVGALHGQN